MTLSTCHFVERIYKEATPVVRFVRNGPDLIIEVGGGARGDGGYISPEARPGYFEYLFDKRASITALPFPFLHDLVINEVAVRFHE